MTDRVAQEALDRALEDDGQLLLVYQPIHDARTRAIRGAEALLRQRRQNGGIREASIITEAAENSPGPELCLLDSMVMRTAFAEAARWPSDIRLHVNLSPKEFEDRKLLDRVRAIIDATGIDPRRLQLEITETSYIEEPEVTMELLYAIRDAGVHLWLDDFGTGHSNLTHLQHFPLDGLKIGGAFVKPLPEDARCRAIVRALLDLGHEIGLPVIAEEVETDEQLAFLLEYRCEFVQGFLFSRPMTAEEFRSRT